MSIFLFTFHHFADYFIQSDLHKRNAIKLCHNKDFSAEINTVLHPRFPDIERAIVHEPVQD